jgi:hypothetical protein
MRLSAVLVALAVAASILVVFTSPAVAARRDTAAWCALVIKFNTQYGTMKNKHYVKITNATQRATRALIKAAAEPANRAKVLAVVPSEIKSAQVHQLDFFTRLVAHHFDQSTPLGTLTLAEIEQLTKFQHVHCGITGP